MTIYEKDIIKATRHFALANNITFGKMQELLILNTIRTVSNDNKIRLQELFESLDHGYDIIDQIGPREWYKKELRSKFKKLGIK